MWRIAAVATLVLASCATTQASVHTRLEDFWSGDNVAGWPTTPEGMAALDARLAALPRDKVKGQRRGPAGDGEVSIELIRDDENDAPADIKLHWLFVDDRLIAVAWEGDLDNDHVKRRLGFGELLKMYTHGDTKLQRLTVYDERFANPKPTPFIEATQLRTDGTPASQRTVYRVYDEGALLKLISDREAVVAKADDERRKRDEAYLEVQQQDLQRKRAAKEAEFKRHPLSLMSAAARRLEARAPMTAAGLWDYVGAEAWELRKKATAATPRGDTTWPDRWGHEASLGNLRTLFDACTKGLPVLDDRNVSRELAWAFDRWSLTQLSSVAPIWSLCYASGGFRMAPWTRAMGRPALSVTLGPRSLAGISEQTVHDDKAIVSQVEEKQQNPEREKAMGPVRALAEQIQSLQRGQDVWAKEANVQANDRSNQVFEGTYRRVDATGHADGPNIASYTGTQSGSAKILEGMATEKSATSARQIAELTAKLQAMIAQLPPETVGVTHSETRVEQHTKQDWKTQLKQRVTIGTSPPLVVDVDTPAYLHVDEGRTITSQSAHDMLMGAQGDELVGQFVEQAFTAWVLKQFKAGSLPGPPPPPGLSPEAADVEKQWTAYFFSGGPRPAASLEMAAWLPPLPADAPRPTDPNRIASWDQPGDSDFVEAGGGFIGSTKRLVYPAVLKDFVFELDVEWVGGLSDGTFGLCWRGSGPNPYEPSTAYTVGLQWSGNYNEFAIQNGKPSSIATGNAGSFNYRPSPLLDHRKNHLRLEARGTRSELQVNGQVLDRLDDATASEGTLCVETSNATVKVSHVSIRPL